MAKPTLTPWLRRFDDAGDPAALAAAYNADPARLTSIRLTAEGLLQALVDAYGIAGDALATDLLQSLDAAAPADPIAALAVDRLRSTDRGIDLGQTAIIALLARLAADANLPLTPTQAHMLWMLSAGPDATAGDVADARTRIAREDAADSAQAAVARSLSRARQINDLARRDGSVTPVTLAEVDAPAGYHWDEAGMLAEEDEA